MTKPTQKPASAKARKTTRPGGRGWGTYVYCIVESGNIEGSLDSAPEGLEHGHKVDIIASAGFGAVVSDVPLSEYGQRALDANLSDVNWAASRVMCHERVVEYFASQRAVIPLRFGTIYIDRRSVDHMLAERAQEFTSTMECLRGREEWGVLIFCDQAELIENHVLKNAAIRPLLERAGSAPPGQQYLLSKQIDGLKAKAAREEISAALALIKKNLDASSEQSISAPLGGRQRTERGELIARLSFLVQSGRFDHFRAIAERLAETYLSSGFRFELVGPLPPYSFVVETSTRTHVP